MDILVRVITLAFALWCIGVDERWLVVPWVFGVVTYCISRLRAGR